MKVGFATLCALMVTACAPVPTDVLPPPMQDETMPDSCDAAKHAHLIGQPGAAVGKAGLRQPYRVIPEGGAMTMDYSPVRINFYLDGKGVIGKIACG